MEKREIPFDDVDFEAQEKALNEKLANFKFDAADAAVDDKDDGDVDFGALDAHDDDLDNAFNDDDGIDDDGLIASLDVKEEDIDFDAATEFDDDAIAKLESEIAAEQADEDAVISGSNAKKQAPAKPVQKQATSPAAKPAAKPAPTTASPTTTSAAPAQKKPAATPAPTATAPAPKAVVSAADVKALGAHISEERSAAYQRLIQLIQTNIADLNTQIKLLLVSKEEGAQAKASQYLQIRRNREKGLETVLQCMKANEPVPPFKIVSLTLERERKGDVGEDEVKVTVVGLSGLKDKKNVYVKYHVDLGRDESGRTKAVKGSKYVEFKHSGVLRLIPKARQSAIVVKSFKTLKMQVEVWEKGFIWDSKLGEGEFKMSPLQKQHSAQQMVKVRDESNNLLCEVDVEVVMQRPMVGRDIVAEPKNMIVVDVEARGKEQDVLAEQAKAQPATHIAVSTPTGAAAGGKAPAAPAAGAAAAGGKPKAAAAVEADEEEVTDITDAILAQIGAPEGITAAELKQCSDVGAFVSPTALEEEKKYVASLVGKTGDAATVKELKSRIDDIDQQIGVFQLLQATGKLSFDVYLDSVKEGCARDELLLKACLLVAKWAEGKNAKELANEYKKKAVCVNRRVKKMKEEIEFMENMDEEEEE